MTTTHTRVLHAYGLFMVAWSVLETVVEAALMKELQLTPERAIVVTSAMQFRQRVMVLIGLLNLRLEPPRDLIRKLQKMEKIARRNAIVHGHIIVGVPDQLTFIKSSVVDGYAAKSFTFTAEALESHISRLTDETIKFQNLLEVSDADMQLLADVGTRASGHAP